MYILGISCYYHDSAASLIKDGKIVAAAQEERFNRNKHSNEFPINAINFCLDSEGIMINEVFAVVFYERPFLKFHRVLKNLMRTFPFSYPTFLRIVPEYLGERLVFPSVLKDRFGFEGEVLFVPHHISHAAAAFFTSPFEKANILTADGIGENSSMMIGMGEEDIIMGKKELRHPGSMGLLYSAITTYLGFGANGDEGKVMALADYGTVRYLDFLIDNLDLKEDGSFTCFERFFDFSSGRKMFKKRLEKEIGKARLAGGNFETHHLDMAASLQAFTEESVIRTVNFMLTRNGLKDLVVAGGVFLNCVLNRKVIEKTDVERLYIFPAAGDAGASSGCALFAYHQIMGNNNRSMLCSASLGPSYKKSEIINIAVNNGLFIKEVDREELIKDCSEYISQGNICAWFQGRMEFGPRALGNRSILAHPGIEGIKDILNNDVKHREWFRPYGVSILDEKGEEYLENYVTNPFMIMTAEAKEEKKEEIRGSLHINDSVRYQSVKESDGIYYRLIKAFYKLTGIPMVINTSFNIQEPIVCDPEDAFDTFIRSRIKRLYIENFIVSKKD